MKLGFVFGGKARDALSSVRVFADFAREHKITHIRDPKDPDIARTLDTDGEARATSSAVP